MSGRRVVVTGVGVISALGSNRNEFWDSLRNGRSGIGPIEAFPTESLRYSMGAEVRGYDHKDYFPNRSAHQLDRFAQFGIIAAREAMPLAGARFRDGEIYIIGDTVTRFFRHTIS